MCFAMTVTAYRLSFESSKAVVSPTTPALTLSQSSEVAVQS
jgi:hypothetical protein